MKFSLTLKPSTALIDLTPLVDVVFLMLVFFIITSDILPLKSLNIQNPEISLPSGARTSQVLVVMDGENVIYVGNKKEIIDLGSFEEALKKEIEKNRLLHPGGETTVVLSIDKQVEYGSFLRLFAIAQKCQAGLRLVYRDTSLCSN
ncbi:MAG: biopolymer transporter ExbD [Chlamydiia bacterium]|nr:biopolymer transporter ExbD [Chlamydiia bacterium]